MSDTHICTLFEKHYHYGLGAFINSLYSSGFKGTLWVGYRGLLPGWIKQLSIIKEESSTYTVASQFKLVFIEMDICTHFTLYKPDFMLYLLDKHCVDARFLFYFDPDILIKTEWAYFENWAKHGIALCEDINSPLSISSPLRCDWNYYFSKHGIMLSSKDNIYVNGGFIGLSLACFSFLEEWKQIQDVIAPDLPTMDQLHTTDRSHPFNKLDQDALNIAKDSTALILSVSNKESMDFSPGGEVMSHAIGASKPWTKNFILNLLKTGNRPTATDCLFFKFLKFPIFIYKGNTLVFYIKLLNFKLTKILSRVLAN